MGINLLAMGKTLYRYVTGIIDGSSDLNLGDETVRNRIGQLLAVAGGALNVKSAFQALSYNLSGTGNFTLTIPVQTCYGLAQGRLFDNVTTAFAQVIAAADATHDRYDVIGIKYVADITTELVSRNKKDPDNPTADPVPVNVPMQRDTVAFFYTQGTPNAGIPAVQAGYDAFLIVLVPATATNLTTGNIFEQFQPLSALLDAASALIPEGQPGSLSFRNGIIPITYQIYDPGYAADVRPPKKVYSLFGGLCPISVNGASAFTLDGSAQPNAPIKHRFKIKLRVKAGAGAQTIGGHFTTQPTPSGGNAIAGIEGTLGSQLTFQQLTTIGNIVPAVSAQCYGQFTLDGSAVTYSVETVTPLEPSPPSTRTYVVIGGDGVGELVWSTSVPDDGQFHELIIEGITTTFGSAGGLAVGLRLRVDPFLPMSNSGFDATKFDFIGPG